MRSAVFVFMVLIATPAVSHANADSIKLRARAYQLAYNLDYEEATRDMAAAAKADPRDAAAERGLAVIPWLQISFQRGAATVDDYLGSLSEENVAMQSPPKDLAARFRTHSANALALAEAAVDANPKDMSALYELGAIVGLQAAYRATVEGAVLSAIKAASRAYDAQETVLKYDKSRADAGLIVGTYQYVVSCMPGWMRVGASWFFGLDGDKTGGIRLIEKAAASGTEASADARFALLLLYNREGRYGDAMRTIGDLQKQFDRNRLLWLEAGATALRWGRAAEAETHLNAGMMRLAGDKRPRMFGEEALWLLKRGTARAVLKRTGEADVDLRRALTLESRKWVTGRVHAELGKLADLKGDGPAARQHFKNAVKLAQEDKDTVGEDAARKWVKKTYQAS